MITLSEVPTQVPITVTYSQLYGLIMNSNLISGATYRITDYKSVNFINGWTTANNNPVPTDPNFVPQQIYTSPNTEVIVVTAISNYELSPTAYSETYQGDILQYQAYTNKIGVILEIYNGAILPDGTGVLGFDLQWDGTNAYFDMPSTYPALFGHYFYMTCSFNGNTYNQTALFEPIVPFISSPQLDYSALVGMTPCSRIKISPTGLRVTLLDLTYAQFLQYDANSLYVEHVQALGNAYGWITRRNNTLNNINVPFDFRGRKYRRFEVDLTAINSGLGLGYYSIGDTLNGILTTGNYQDFPVFSNAWRIYNIEWSDIGGADAYYQNGFSDNNVFANNCFDNKFSYFTYNNTFVGETNFNQIESNFYTNVCIAFNSNVVCSSFNNNLCLNVLVNEIGANFENNIIQGGFQSNKIQWGFNGNNISNNFYDNQIGSQFSGNTIQGNFEKNIIGSAFQQNQITNGFSNNIIGSLFTFNQISCFANNNIIGENAMFNVITFDFARNNITFFSFNTMNVFSNNICDWVEGNTISTCQRNNVNYFVGNIVTDSMFDNIATDIDGNTADSISENQINSISQNVIGSNFYRNKGIKIQLSTIGNNFNVNVFSAIDSCIMVNNFQQNIINCPLIFWDFSLSTYVYQPYNCIINNRSDLNPILSYIDGGNNVLYQLITA